MIRINKNLALFSGLLFLLGASLLFTLQKFSPLIGHVTYYCQSLLIDANMIPIPYYLSIIPFMVLFIVLAISFIKFFVLSLKVQFLKLKLKGNMIVDRETNKLIKRLGLKDQAILVKSNKQFAFCLGLKSPKIYISTGLISQLSEKEIEAVLRHEQYHLENHDTFTMIIASVAHSLFPFFPSLGDLINKYRVEREIQADKFAVRKVGDSYPLVSALRKLLTLPNFETVAVAAIADKDTLEPRIYSLLNKTYTSHKFKLRHAIITFFSAFIFGAVIVLPVHAQEIHHEEHEVMMLCSAGGECMRSCTSNENLTKLYSEIPVTKKISEPNSSQPYTPMR